MLLISIKNILKFKNIVLYVRISCFSSTEVRTLVNKSLNFNSTFLYFKC